MAGPAPKELQQFCTGCAQHFVVNPPWNISTSIPQNTSGTSTNLLAKYKLSGAGNGAFANVTGFYLGELSVYSIYGSTGNCTAVTGSLSYTGVTGAVSGLTGWRSQSITGCTGTSGCRSLITVHFSGNSNIWGMIPQAMVTVYGYDYTYGLNIFTQTLTSGSQSTAKTYPMRYTECGYTQYNYVYVSARVPGYSGEVFTDTIFGQKCSPCLLG